jgi:MoxR-like ATPase
MDQNNQFKIEFAHLLKLALAGDQKGVGSFARRVARQAKTSEPDFSSVILEVLQASRPRPAVQGLRDGMSHEVPVDRESRQHLVRIERPTEPVEPPILPSAVMRQIEQVILERRNSSKLEKAGLEPSRTVLFSGAPGVGKTMTARWIANQLEWPLFALDLSSVMGSFLGRTGSNLKRVLEFAKIEECVLLLDEFDAVAKRRDDDSEVGELKRLVTVLMQEIDLWPSDRLLIAATNHGELLDSAVWRRFDMVVRFPLPNPDGVIELLRREIGKGLSDKWIRALSIAMQGRSFGEVVVEVRRARRQSILFGTPMADVIADTVTTSRSDLSKGDLKTLAVGLHGIGLSQREVSQITGLARDTLRTLEVDWK